MLENCVGVMFVCVRIVFVCVRIMVDGGSNVYVVI